MYAKQAVTTQIASRLRPYVCRLNIGLHAETGRFVCKFMLIVMYQLSSGSANRCCVKLRRKPIKSILGSQEKKTKKKRCFQICYSFVAKKQTHRKQSIIFTSRLTPKIEHRAAFSFALSSRPEKIWEAWNFFTAIRFSVSNWRRIVWKKYIYAKEIRSHCRIQLWNIFHHITRNLSIQI